MRFIARLEQDRESTLICVQFTLVDDTNFFPQLFSEQTVRGVVAK